MEEQKTSPTNYYSIPSIFFLKQNIAGATQSLSMLMI